MSILSDLSIRQLCEPPTHAIVNTEGEVQELFTPRDNDHLEVVSWRAGKRLSHVVDATPEMVRKAGWEPMISPFIGTQVRTRPKGWTEDPVKQSDDVWSYVLPEDFDYDGDERVISYGLSSYGYDIRLAREFKIFTNVHNALVDPKNFNGQSFVEHEGDYCVIPPNSFVLGRTVEHFSIPRDILTICLGKSTFARCGVVVNVTPLEPEWRGYLTLEFSNTTPLPAKLYAGEGCAQVLFLRGDRPCSVSYKDRGGKYMQQAAVPVAPLM